MLELLFVPFLQSMCRDASAKDSLAQQLFSL